MKYVLKHILLIMSAFACILVFPNCRGEIIPTEGDLASYGWVLYEGSDFDNARVWFGDAMRKDSTYIDSYNGMGWITRMLIILPSVPHINMVLRRQAPRYLLSQKPT